MDYTQYCAAYAVTLIYFAQARRLWIAITHDKHPDSSISAGKLDRCEPSGSRPLADRH